LCIRCAQKYFPTSVNSTFSFIAQITVEVLTKIVSTTNYESALGTLESTSNIELLPDGSRRTFIQRHDEPMFGGLFCGVATQWTSFGWDQHTNDVEGGGSNNNSKNNGDIDYYFHLCRKENVICLCISDDTDIRYHNVNYEFLDDVNAKFTKSYAPYKITKAKAYEMDKKFRQELSKLIYFYNENRNKMVRQDKVQGYLEKVDDLKGILGRNISMILEREGTLIELAERSDQMLEDTKVFTKRTSKLKKRVQKEYYTYHVIAAVFGILVFYFFLAEICGWDFSKCAAS